MPAEEGTDLEAEILAATRFSSCSVCDWLDGRDDAANWDRFLAGPVSKYGHTAIHAAMRKRDYRALSCKPIENHRREKHRVG